ncbi:MAG: sulfatase-like hydrolase/transferase [Opitutales bacterium]
MTLFRTLSVFACCLSLYAQASSTRPNIILVMADDMGYGDPSYVSQDVNLPNGSPHPDRGWISTPNSDAMAANGLRFDRFYSASGVCSPTRASCLTGRNPFRVGVTGAGKGKLGIDETPLSEILSEHGYTTGHFGKWHLGKMSQIREDGTNSGKPPSEFSAPWQHGYDACFASIGSLPTYHPYRMPVNGDPLPTQFETDVVVNNKLLSYHISDPSFYGTYYWKMPEGVWETAQEGTPATLEEVNNLSDGDTSKLLTDQAIAFIEDAVDAEKPFFVVLWYNTPHSPLVDPLEIECKNHPDTVKRTLEDMDTALGNLRNSLQTLGVQDNTMLWFTSDNGPEKGYDSPNEQNNNRAIRAGGYYQRKQTFWEGGIRVPGLLEWPAAIPNARRTDFVAVTSDYLPTILDYLDINYDGLKALDGISLRPVIEDRANARSTPVGFRHNKASRADLAWMTEEYKMISNGGGEFQLYDMTLSPEETELTPLATDTDLASRPQDIQDVFNNMLSELNAWHATIPDDTLYIHPSRPSATITAPAHGATAPVPFTVNFSKPVTGLSPSDFAVTGGVAENVSGTGSSYTVYIVPTADTISMSLPAGSAIGLSGEPSTASNSVSAQDFVLPYSLSIDSVPASSWTTVDSTNTSPATDGNNLSTFSGSPYTTTLYARGHSNTSQRVRALVNFNLPQKLDGPISSAHMSFQAYSVNGSQAASIEALALNEAWNPSGSPTPPYGITTRGDVIDGGEIHTDLDGNLEKTYQFDITQTVRSWYEDPNSNYGILLRIADDTDSNGIGIKPTGIGSIQITIQQVPLKISESKIVQNLDTGLNELRIKSPSLFGQTYFLQQSQNLKNWEDKDSAIASGLYIEFSPEMETASLGKKFFRLSNKPSDSN